MYQLAPLIQHRLLVSSPQIASASSLSKTIASQLEKCPSDNYVIVTQPGVNVADYNSRLSAPYLKQMISGSNKDIRSRIAVGDVLGEVDADEMVRVTQEQCGAVLLRIDASSKPPII